MKNRFRNLENDLIRPTDYLATNIDNLAAKGRGISVYRDHLRADIFLEDLVKVIAQDHAVVEDHVLLETLEGKLFAPKVLERSEGQLALALVMKGSDDSVRTKQPIQLGFLKLGIHSMPHAQVCVDHRTGSNKRQKDLAVLAHGAGKDRPPKFVPLVMSL
ncbi:MAG: hypothetical protein U5L00_13675 [Desulfovermiculus sp.]|nr:hypothetical protein [Desulfovermiculus sp.]